MIERIDYKEDLERAIAVFETNLGTFQAELYAKECPETVWNFINLAEGRQTTERGGNFYDGLTFHRVIKGFVIQGGCPWVTEPEDRITGSRTNFILPWPTTAKGAVYGQCGTGNEWQPVFCYPGPDPPSG